MSLDGDNTHTFYLYVSMRLLCQAVVMRYSLEIPTVTIHLSESIEANSEKGKIKSNDGFVDEYNEGGSNNDTLDGADRNDTMGVELVERGEQGEALIGDNKEVTEEPIMQKESNADHKHQMKLFMNANMAVFILICVGFIIYIFASDQASHLNFRELFFSVLISVAILINIRAFYSCVKWFWLHAYGITYHLL